MDEDDSNLIFAILEVTNHEIAVVKYSLNVQEDLTWIIHYRNKPLTLQPDILFPHKLSSSTVLLQLMHSISSLKLCEGNRDKSWHVLRGWKAKKFLNNTG